MASRGSIQIHLGWKICCRVLRLFIPSESLFTDELFARLYARVCVCLRSFNSLHQYCGSIEG